MQTMKEMHGFNPASEWGDETLERKYKNLYHRVHAGDGSGVLYMASLWAYEQELMNRGIDPSSLLKTA